MRTVQRWKVLFSSPLRGTLIIHWFIKGVRVSGLFGYISAGRLAQFCVKASFFPCGVPNLVGGLVFELAAPPVAKASACSHVRLVTKPTFYLCWCSWGSWWWWGKLTTELCFTWECALDCLSVIKVKVNRVLCCRPPVSAHHPLSPQPQIGLGL